MYCYIVFFIGIYVFFYILDHVLLPNTTLTYINIYFDSATMDTITYSMKTDFETKLSTIGGTMGLFTGFSLLSAVEIVYHLGICITKKLRKMCQNKQQHSLDTNFELDL